MNLNDPFGRVERRKQISYDAMRQGLIESGVTTREAAARVQKEMLRRALFAMLFVVLVGAGILLVLPGSRGAVLVVGVMILLWLLSTALNGYGSLKRYIREELSD